VTASFLADKLPAQDLVQSQVNMQNTATNVIYIQLAGAPSYTDLFDYKQVAQQPAAFAPTTINGAMFPTGLMPKMAQHLQNGDFSIVRSVSSWGLVHTLMQTWVQIGRNPSGVLGNISPNIGSVVAIEKIKPNQLFPTFLALNAGNCAGPGYFAAQYAAFKVTPATNGLRNTTTKTVNRVGPSDLTWFDAARADKLHIAALFHPVLQRPRNQNGSLGLRELLNQGIPTCRFSHIESCRRDPQRIQFFRQCRESRVLSPLGFQRSQQPLQAFLQERRIPPKPFQKHCRFLSP
jgi:hypothetical protein